MLGAGDPLADRQQRGELVPGPGRIPRLPGPAGQVGAGGQRVGVLGAGDPLADRQQRGELVPGPGRIPRLPGPGGQVVAGGERVGVLGAPGLLPGAQDLLLHGQRRGVAAARAEVPGQLVHAVAGRVQRGLGMRQQRREHRPAPRVLRVAGQRGLDHRGGGPPPGLRLLRRGAGPR